ncbi:MAG: thioredoxin domain-containing protein [Anaerolineae bacterium]|nr:thioredoxin domain-containing protein [Anaerolineae bacterium]
MSKQAKRKNSPQQIVFLIITIFVVLAMAAGAVVSLLDAERTSTGLDAIIARYAGVPTGVTEGGLPYLGSPGAPVLVHEISDFTCDDCATFHDEVLPLLLDEHIKNGDAWLIYAPAASDRAGSEPSTRAAVCALRQGKFWEMHDWLYGWRGLGYTEAELVEAVEALGMNTNAFLACLVGPESELALQNVEKFLDEKRADGTFTDTLTVYVNNEVLSSWRSVIAAVGAALQP